MLTEKKVIQENTKHTSKTISKVEKEEEQEEEQEKEDDERIEKVSTKMKNRETRGIRSLSIMIENGNVIEFFFIEQAKFNVYRFNLYFVQ